MSQQLDFTNFIERYEQETRSKDTQTVRQLSRTERLIAELILSIRKAQGIEVMGVTALARMLDTTEEDIRQKLKGLQLAGADG